MNAEMFRVMREKKTNLLDSMVEGLVNNLKFSDQDVLYPDGTPKSGDGVDPAWFYDAQRGSNGFSELDSIHGYVNEESMYEDISEIMLGISLIEMRHYAKLTDLIVALDGNPNVPNSTWNVTVGRNAKESLSIAIDNEKKAIAGYEDIVGKVSAIGQNDTTKYVLGLLAKLIADERLHVRLLEERQGQI